MSSVKKRLYNIALDCVDDKAGSPRFKNRAALAFVSGNVMAGQRETGVKITYSNLKKLTDRAAQTFFKLKLKSKSFALIRLGNVPEFPIAFLGAIKAGLIPIPVSPLLPAGELKNLIKTFDVRAVVSTWDSALQKLTQSSHSLPRAILAVCDKDTKLPKKILRFQEELLKHDKVFRAKTTPANAPAFALLTSGTKGEPKLVLHAHRCLLAHDERMKHWLGFQSGDVVFNTSALNWSYAVNCGLLDVLRHGGTSLIYNGPLDAGNILHVVNRFGATVLMSVPALYRRMVEFLDSHHIAFESLRTCVSAAELLGENIAKRFCEITGKVISQGLGMTENSVYLFQDVNVPFQKANVGQPARKKSVRIVKDGKNTKAFEVGEIVIHKNDLGLMLGYMSKGELQKPWQRDWFHTGDLAFKDDKGSFYFVGRNDDMLNINGYRVSPLEVEAKLNTQASISESAVFPARSRSNSSYLVAAVVLAKGFKKSKALESEILRNCDARLANYKVPKKILFLKELPKTRNGKIQRHVLGK